MSSDKPGFCVAYIKKAPDFRNESPRLLLLPMFVVHEGLDEAPMDVRSALCFQFKERAVSQTDPKCSNIKDPIPFLPQITQIRTITFIQHGAGAI